LQSAKQIGKIRNKKYKYFFNNNRLLNFRIGMPMSIVLPYRIEPCLLENITTGMTDLIANLTTPSERLANRLHPRTAASLAELVRIMNGYYSNLIEGHHTKTRDIERALTDDLETDELQHAFRLRREHVRLLWSIDQLYAEGRLPEPAAAEFLRWLHSL
jgi:Fic family protein